MINIFDFEGFQWDEGNKNKNYIKHKVSNIECEEIFLNHPLFTYYDEKHSVIEERYYALGRTDKNRYLYIVFTVRGKLIRVISARDMTKIEREIYLQ